MSMSSPQPDKKYTYGDYLKWPDEERWEIIDGVPYDMSPAPSAKHQTISMRLSRNIMVLFPRQKVPGLCRPL